MNDNFIRVAAATPKVVVADPAHNRRQIQEMMKELDAKGVDVCCFPELVLTGYTCGDLFLQKTLLKKAEEELQLLLEETADIPVLTAIGIPFANRGKLYNAMCLIQSGEILMIVPKKHIPNYGEFYEARHFTQGPAAQIVDSAFAGQSDIYFGYEQLLYCENYPGLVVAAEICEDLWVIDPPSNRHARAGATLILNGSASNDVVGKRAYRTNLVRAQAAKTLSAYVYASAGAGESTTDLVFSGHNIICESSYLLQETPRGVDQGYVIADVDFDHMEAERRRMTTFQQTVDTLDDGLGYQYGGRSFSLPDRTLARLVSGDDALLRKIPKHPFVPAGEQDREERAEEILSIQSRGLAKRLEHTRSKKAVLGISGGLDSTLALLVTLRAFDLLGLKHEDVICITMPSFGTTDRTYQNAVKLVEGLGATLREIDIQKSVKQHFQDIGLAVSDRSTAFENAQARERTQVLMDVANMEGGLVVGTGDLSELALGWATYNGDHMSMYGVNAGVPKTLVRHLVRTEGHRLGALGEEVLQQVLYDIVDTPVSPELLPPSDGKIEQITEDHVGPYELQDFTLYYALRFGYGPKKIFRLQKQAFRGEYDEKTLIKWLGVFFRRFFTQQFKRSCLPDGPKVGSVSLSPRGDLRMPSDASYAAWLEEVEALESGR